MPKLDIAALEAAEKAATPSPWSMECVSDAARAWLGAEASIPFNCPHKC
jgi:hypothetical protein